MCSGSSVMKVPISREGREKWGTPAHRAGRSRRLRLRVAADVRSFTGPLARFGITDILGCLEVCRLRSEAGREACGLCCQSLVSLRCYSRRRAAVLRKSRRILLAIRKRINLNRSPNHPNRKARGRAKAERIRQPIRRLHHRNRLRRLRHLRRRNRLNRRINLRLTSLKKRRMTLRIRRKRWRKLPRKWRRPRW